MRILCVTSGYPPHHTGGYELVCHDVLVRLAARGHSVTVLTADDRVPGVDDPPGERSGTIPVRRDLVRYFRDEQLWAPGPIGRWRLERANMAKTRAAIDASDPDVIMVGHIGALSLSVLRVLLATGRPIVYSIQDDWLTYCAQLDRWLTMLRRLGPLAAPVGRLVGVSGTLPDLGDSGAFCFVSELTRDRSETLSPWHLSLTAIVYSCIDGTLFAPRSAPPPWQWRLLYVGRLDARKGIETLIRAMPLLPATATLELRCTGSPAEEERLERIARELGVGERVEFVRGSRAELADRYRAVDVCVFPSEWDEPFGLVPIEAMACGTPTVASGTGGSAEFLFDGDNCVLFTPGDSASLAEAVERLASDRALRERIVAAGFRTAEYFDASHLADAYEQWFVAAAAGYRDGHPASRHFTLDTIRA